MEILDRIDNLNWLPIPNEMSAVLTNELPDEERITGSFVLILNEDNILLTKVGSRSWDIPGGHKENGETPMETAYREVLEETNIKVKNLTLVGYDKLLVKADKPKKYPYPYPESFLAYYTAEIDEMNEFTADFETTAIRFFSFDEAKNESWFLHHKQFFDSVINKKANR